MTKTKIKIRISKKWLLFALMLFICAAATAYAGEATSPLGGTASNAFNDAMKSLANLLVALLQLLKKILWPIFLLIGGLLNNDLIFGAGMEERLLMIWTQIRNFVNIGFVIILVGVALYNVTGFAKEEYDVKKFLPKFAIALIAVNFSYVALKIVLDVTNVFTVAIFAMPKTISADLVSRNSLAFQDPAKPDNYIQKCSDLDKKTSTCGSEVSKDAKGNIITEKDEVQKIVNGYCSTLYGPADKFVNKPTTDKNDLPYCESAASTQDKTTKVVGGNYKLTQQGLKFFSSFTANNASLILAIQFMNIVDVDKVSASVQAGATADFMKITMNLMFSSLLYIIYGVAYVSLFILLLVRLVVLWLIICLSPVIALKLAGIKFADGGRDFGKMFVDHAVAPVKLAIVLTIGFMMLDAFKTVNIAKETNKEALGVTLTKLQTELSGLSTLQSFVMAAAAVIFIWVGVKEASKGTQADKYIGSLMGKFEHAGSTIAGLWKYAPMLPTGEGKQSFMQLKKAINAPLDTLKQKYSGETTSEMGIEEIRGLKNKKNMTRNEVQDTFRKLQTGGFTTDRHTKETQDLLKTWAKSGNEHQMAMAKQLQRKLNPGEFDKLMGKSTLTQLEKNRITGGLSYVAGAAPLAAAPRAPAAPPAKAGAAAPAATTTGTTPQAQQVAVLQAAQADPENNIGWKNLDPKDQEKVRGLLIKRSAAANGADVATRDAEVKKVEAEMAGDDSFKRAAAIVQASTETETGVSTSATAVSAETGEIKGKPKADLKRALEQAKQKLVKSKPATGLDDNKIKAILKQTLEKAGVKQSAIDKTKDISDLVQ